MGQLMGEKAEEVLNKNVQFIGKLRRWRVPITEIAEHYNVEYNTCYNWLNKRGILRPRRNDYRGIIPND